MAGVIGQILILDLVFSLDSIITAVGMTDDIPIMIVAVVVAVGLMLLAADPLARFIGNNPTIVMLALGFLLMIGMTLIADGVGVKVPKGYIYAAMAFSALVEALNMLARRAQRKRRPLRTTTALTSRRPALKLAAMKLKDRVAIVTGGASGIGAASARLFAAEGAKLALVDQDEVGLGQVAADIEAAAAAPSSSPPTSAAMPRRAPASTG